MENQCVGETGGMGERRMVRTQERGEKGGRSDRKWGERKGEGGERREGQKRKGERGMGEGRAARICWAVATAVAARHPHSAATRAATDRLVRGDSKSPVTMMGTLEMVSSSAPQLVPSALSGDGSA
jgi:hypothetical protein